MPWKKRIVAALLDTFLGDRSCLRERRASDGTELLAGGCPRNVLVPA